MAAPFDSQTTGSSDNHCPLRASIKGEIDALINPYKDGNQEPPFSAPELVVMAALCSPERTLTFGETLDWIVRTFGYYCREALKAYVAASMESDKEPKMVVSGFDEAFDCWEAPLVYRGNERFTVPIMQGRTFLRKWLEPRREGSFTFLRLPAELRNTIYEMVFSFPDPGILIRSSAKRHHGMLMLQREDDKHCDDFDWFDNPESVLETAPMQRMLALLSVNQQIYEEAVTCFYEINHFHFEDIRAFTVFTNTVPMSRLQHLKEVSIRLDYTTADPRTHLIRCIDINEFSLFMAAAQRFSQVASLRKLTMLTDSSCFDLPRGWGEHRGRSSKYTKAEQPPGLRDFAIAASRAQTWNVRGECPQVQDFLRREVNKLQSTESKKRHRSDVDTTESSKGPNWSENGEKATMKKRTRTSN